MNQPPPESDPNELTQPIPAVGPADVRQPSSPPPAPPLPPPRQRGPRGPQGPYVHRFWSLPIDLFGRLAAFAIDVFGVPFVLTAFAFAAFDRGVFTYGARNPAGFETLAAASFAIAIVVAYLCEALTGATLGKLVFGLHVRRTDGGHAGGGRVFVRYLFVPIDLLLIGPLLVLVTPRRQRLGDVVAGTVVSRSPLGLFAPLLGLVLVLLIGFAQITYGGGLTSAIEVAAETSNVAPAVIGRSAATLGIGATWLGALHPAPVATPSVLETPYVASTPDTSSTPDVSSSTPDVSASLEPSSDVTDGPGSASSAP